MAGIDDAHSLAELSIPGSHDSGALYEPYAGLAKCQKLSIADQLAAGVRYFDVRCRHVDDAFLIYHGSIDQNQTYDDVLATMYRFLDEHPSETIIASVKEEATPSHTTRTFEATFASYIDQAPDRWVLAPTVPNLGDVRGHIVLLRRFSATAVPLGIDATQWPDNTTFAIDDADAHLRIEDNYMVNTPDDKWAAITGHVAEAPTTDPTTLSLTYTSGFETMNELPNITIVSDDINARLDDFLAGAGEQRLGTLVMDFVDPSRAAAVIATNPR